MKILPLPQLEEQAWKTHLAPLELQGDSQRQSRASCGAGGDSWCCSPSQGWELGAHRNKSQLIPAEMAPGSRKPQPWGRADSGTENTNPVPGAALRGVCCSPQSLGRTQPFREWGQSPGGACRELFCQDSQGNRVIAHRDRDRDSSLRASCSPRQQLELGSESLFTQDSEGNRVIKHW